MHLPGLRCENSAAPRNEGKGDEDARYDIAMTGLRFGERIAPSTKVADYLNLPEVEDPIEPYVRPADWPALPTLTNNRFHGLMAVNNNPEGVHYAALKCTVTGGYTVNWGDGVVENFASGTVAEHMYTYSTLGTTVTSRGYKTAIVQVYPQVGGNNITAFDLRQRHTSLGGEILPDTYDYPIVETWWLELEIQASAMTSLTISKVYPGVTFTNVERLVLGQNTVTDLSNMCRDMRNLQSVSMTTESAQYMGYLFGGCVSLTVSPEMDTSDVVDISTMFYGCRSLVSIPQYDYSSVLYASLMLYGCSQLRRVPIINMPLVQYADYLFGECTSLEHVSSVSLPSAIDVYGLFYACTKLREAPVVHLPSAESVEAMFQFCTGLTRAPGLDLPAAIYADNMFNTCYSLTRVDSLNLPSCVDMEDMFSDCWSLKRVQLAGAPQVIDTKRMFQRCYSLQEAPDLDTSLATDMRSMFQQCISLREAPPYDTSAAVYVESMFSGCTSLQNSPVYDLSSAASARYMFESCTRLENINLLNMRSLVSQDAAPPDPASSLQSNCNNLKTMQLGACAWSVEVRRTSLGTNALNAMYTSLAAVNSRSLTSASGDGTEITYTTSAAHHYIVGQSIVVQGFNQSGYNTNTSPGAVITAVPSATTFKIAGTATGASSGSATAYGSYGRGYGYIYVDNDIPGYATSTTSIATNKGWTFQVG